MKGMSGEGENTGKNFLERSRVEDLNSEPFDCRSAVLPN